MDCRDVAELADSFLSEQLLVETNHEILQHLATCRRCRAELAVRRRLRAALRHAYSHAPELEARTAFVAGLTDRLRRQQRARRLAMVWRRLTAIAAGLALAAALGWAGRDRAAAWRFAALARAAAGDHRNCALHFALAERPIPLDEAARRFDPAYAALTTVTPSPASLALGPLAIVERHSCVFDGRRYAHLVIQYRGELVSVLIATERGPAAAAPPAGLRRVDDSLVASFRAGRYLVFVVSPFGGDDTRQIASAIAGPLARALAS